MSNFLVCGMSGLNPLKSATGKAWAQNALADQKVTLAEARQLESEIFAEGINSDEVNDLRSLLDEATGKCKDGKQNDYEKGTSEVLASAYYRSQALFDGKLLQMGQYFVCGVDGVNPLKSQAGRTWAQGALNDQQVTLSEVKQFRLGILSNGLISPDEISDVERLYDEANGFCHAIRNNSYDEESRAFIVELHFRYKNLYDNNSMGTRKYPEWDNASGASRAIMEKYSRARDLVFSIMSHVQELKGWRVDNREVIKRVTQFELEELRKIASQENEPRIKALLNKIIATESAELDGLDN